jgi:hypothetical protein
MSQYQKRLPNVAVLDQLIKVTGVLREIVQPKQLDAFTGYGDVFLLDGRRMSGTFPFLSFDFQYNFKCHVENSPVGVLYRIVEPVPPTFVPLPLTSNRLISILKTELGFGDQQTRDLVAELKHHPLLMQFDFENLDPKVLLTTLVPTPDWLTLLAQNSIYFKYPFMEMLSKFWPYSDLKALNIQQLLNLGNAFDRDPEQFCYSWKNKTHLPELTREEAQKAFRLLNKEPDPLMLTRLAIYNNMKAVTKKTKNLAVSMDVVAGWSIPYKPAVAKKIVQPVNVDVVGIPQQYLFITKDWEDLKFICHSLSRLMGRLPNKNLWLQRLPADYGTLVPAQQTIFHLCKRMPILILNGGGGVGKSYLAKVLYDMSKKKFAIPVAYFGRVASLLKKFWKRGITIHRMFMLVQMETEEGREILDNIRRVFIDEGSHLTVEVLAMAFRCCPKLEQIVIIGDEAQMRPPGAGPIYESLVEFYKDTPIVQTLTEIMRVDREDADAAHIMIENALKIRDGRTDLVWSRKFDGTSPFIVLSRRPIPPSLRGKHGQQTRVMLMKESLTPIVQNIADYQSYQILACTHDIIYDLNLALSMVYDNLEPEHGGERVFKVGSKIMFTQNYYPQVLSMPKDPAKRALFKQRPEWYLRTDQVSRAELDIIAKIVDIEPLTGAETEVLDTAAAKAIPRVQRIIRMQSGHQINLSTLPLSKIARGDVCTMHSAQGSEYETTIFYIDEQDVEPYKGHPPRLNKNDIYTVYTRSRKRTIFICKANYDDLAHSDIGVAIRNQRKPLDHMLFQWLPPYTESLPAPQNPNAVQEAEEPVEDDAEESGSDFGE